jgi:hypothetical protein
MGATGQPDKSSRTRTCPTDHHHLPDSSPYRGCPSPVGGLSRDAESDNRENLSGSLRRLLAIPGVKLGVDFVSLEDEEFPEL